MKVKSSIKKVGAVAGSALMVGLTMGSAATLGDYPQPFVDDDGEVASQIVVGSNGKVADVVGAVNLAAGLGQAAVQTETRETPGGAAVEADGHSEETDIRGGLNDGNELVLGSFDYSELTFDTEWGDDDHLVEESVTVNPGDVEGVSVDVNETEVVTTVDADAVEYSVEYAPAFNVSDSIYVLGETYTITDMGEDNGDAYIDLGSEMEQQNLELDDSYEHGPYTVTVIDKDEANSKIYVQVSKDGEALQSSGLHTEDNPTMEVDNGAFTVTANEVFFGSRSDYIDVTSVYTDTEVEHGEDSPWDEDYTVSIAWDDDASTANFNVLESLTLSNKLVATTSPDEDEETHINALREGDSFAGPADFFSVDFAALDDHETEDLSVSADNENNNIEVRYTDGLGNTNTVDMSLLTDANGPADDGLSADDVVGVDRRGQNYPVQVDEIDGAVDGGQVDVTLAYADYERTAELDGEDSETVKVGPLTVEVVQTDTAGDGTGWEIQITGGEASLHTQFEGELTGNGDAVTLDEGEGYSIDFTEDPAGDGSTAGELEVTDSSDSPVWDPLTDEDDEERTSFGSLVEVGEGAESVSVDYPESQVMAHLTVGSSEVSETSGETYEAYTGPRALPDMAQLDSEVTESVRSNNHLILVGGPAVNTLVETLHDEGDVDLSDVEDDQSGAVLQVVNDAFTDGQHALVVAGYEAADTRSASRYLSNHVDHEDALADAGERMVLTEADYPSEQ